MHGPEGEERKRRWHMWPVPAPGTATSAAAAPSLLARPASPSENPSLELENPRLPCDSFLKDGRKIQVGDCALFQAGSAPPFIGIIHWITSGKEGHLWFCVNWLYRPADVKLAKDVLLEAAPNEVFYSFHKDVISAASLLHPCKVSFLRKGVELPVGISSFVCRRVYDITNKCLWWLTDKDYVTDRQEEVHQLLNKTRLEMNTAPQSGGNSPTLNGPTSTQQPKSGSESVHDTNSSVLSQTKGKKRDKSDQVSEFIKKEHSAKPDDGGSVSFKSENMVKTEIVKITEKGRLVSSKGVDKLLNLMQLHRSERKIDASVRILVADVIAATDRYDCLGRFVQLNGVPILDDWLQEVYKWKTSDGSSPKECDKAIEELILALLRALDKLPVNLNALQSCNIGKSVNHLRNHKNPEIQKKARSLIDTWKKRVDAEITKINDAKSITSSQPVWQVKPESCDVSKSITPASIVDVSKDPLCKAATNTGGVEMPATTAKDEKSSSSSESQNNSQSCSSDHAKTIGSLWKEDKRNSSAGSMNASKAAGSSTCHRRSSNGFSGASMSAVHKETHLGKSGTLNRMPTLEKSSQSDLACEKPIDMSVANRGNNHRLIVKLPNHVQSPAQSVSGGSFEDPSILANRASSPGVQDKHEHSEFRVKLRGDVFRSNIVENDNTEAWQSNDIKEPPVGAGDVRSLAAIHDEEHMSAQDMRSATEAPGAAGSSSGTEKEVFLTEPSTRSSFSSINALIESCIKYSEASVPLVVEDDVGMNLLASVATGEISNSELISPTVSPGNSPATETKSRLSNDDVVAQSHVESDEAAFADSKKQYNKLASEHAEQSPTVAMSSHRECKPEEEKDGHPFVLKPSEVEKQGDDGTPFDENPMTDGQVLDHYTEYKLKERSSSADENKPPIECAIQNIGGGNICNCEISCKDPEISASGIKSENLIVEESQSCPSAEEALEVATSSDHQRSVMIDSVERSRDAVITLGASDVPFSKNADESVRPATTSSYAAGLVEDLKMMETHERHQERSASEDQLSSCQAKETENQAKPAGSRLSGVDSDVRADLALSAEASSLAVKTEPDIANKLDFDLNEGILGDDGNLDETAVSVATVCSSAIFFPGLSSFANAMSNSSPAPITVAAPAKGPFVPPQNLLKSKGETGWKGSAATSAFRPAEPRKAPEMPPSVSAGKQCRRQLNIDLNEPDERVLEDMAVQNCAKSSSSELGTVINREATPQISGGLNLDLNRVDEGTENGQLLASTTYGLEVPFLAVGPASGEVPNRVANMSRELDLNSGPGLDDACAAPTTGNQNTKCTRSIPFVPPVAGIRMNTVDLGSLSPWFPPGSSYPAQSIPSSLTDRGEQPCPIVAAPGAQRILGPVTASGPFGGDGYRGPMFSSSTAMAFSPATAFPYAGFAFGSNFPLASTSFSGGSTTFVDSSSGAGSGFPTIPSPFFGQAGAILSSYPRPYVISLPEGNSDSTRKWIAPGLDLNAGPGNTDLEGKDERLPLASRQLLVATSQAFTEEQVRMYGVPGGGLKRKEPEGGWDANRSTYKQLSWQ
uniref:Uncharacterized protein n=1 Tax=Musa acuminata subsp. malaccensis TaxID=214687 RepID=A0A804KB35_MUSAM|nr:PREDICTED: uncharacterized protein LOC103996233 isoform X2 [Musa acuminata subsp. malaccensis]